MYSVLLVDDEPVILAGLKSIINWEELGLQITGCAQSAAEALGLMKMQTFDIVMTDVRMPEMSGLSLIAEMRKQGYKSKVLIISGFNEFEYLKAAIHYQVEDYIVKPVDENELTKTLMNIADKLEIEKTKSVTSKIINTMLLDNIVSAWATNTLEESALQERLMLFNINLQHQYYTLMIVRLLILSADSHDESSYENIGLITQQICPQQDNLYTGFTMSGDLLIIHASDQTYPTTFFKQSLVDFTSAWSAKLDFSSVASIGKRTEHALSLHESYVTACSAIDYVTLLPSETIMSYEAFAKHFAGILDRLPLQVETFENLLQSDNVDIKQKKCQLSVQLKALLHQTRLSGNQIIALSAYKIMTELKKNNTYIFESCQLCQEIRKIYDESDFHNQVDQLFDIFIKLVNQKRQADLNSHPVVKRTIRYIEQYFKEDLSLCYLATKFNISQTHLGRIFKSETGKLFTDYVNDFRIRKAKELLINTTLRSSDVAAEVGFSNPNYFANVFKKIVGVYPTKFRKQLR